MTLGEDFELLESSLNKSNTLKSGINLRHIIRNSHSSSLNHHHSNLPDKLPIRSSLNLISRGPSYPELPIDNSYEAVKETHLRRSIHSQILIADRKAFCKYYI